jgi:uncharacterized membrane protein YecN with MAPEG domain
MAGGGAKADGAEITLEHTPTWIVASVCSIIVVISLLFERLLHRLGKVRTSTAGHMHGSSSDLLICLIELYACIYELFFLHDHIYRS